MRAARKAGELLKVREKAKGFAGNPGGRGAPIVRSENSTAHPKTLAELGISKQQSSDWQKLAAVPREEFETALADAAAGFQRRWKPVKDVADRAGECWVDADVKRGQELAKVPKAIGTRGNFLGGSNKAPPRTKPKDDVPTRAEMHVGKEEAARSLR
jgi:hypothetical protein